MIVIGQSVGAVRTDLPQTFLTNVLFATVREIDHWFAVNWPNLSEEETLHLNNKAVDMLAAMATPPEV